jgi:hypothetical protein
VTAPGPDGAAALAGPLRDLEARAAALTAAIGRELAELDAALEREARAGAPGAPRRPPGPPWRPRRGASRP